MTNYEIVRLGDIWENEKLFTNETETILNRAIELMREKYEVYNFENHIYDLKYFLNLFYFYYKKNIMLLDNIKDKEYWLEQFIIKMVDTIPSLYVTSKLITEKFLEQITPEMGFKTIREAKTGLNTSDFNFDMENNKFGSVGKIASEDKINDISMLLSRIINWAYPSFIGTWLQSFRPFLFITTFMGGD